MAPGRVHPEAVVAETADATTADQRRVARRKGVEPVAVNAAQERPAAEPRSDD